MPMYRVVLDAFNSRSTAKPARVVTYCQGWNREAAMRTLNTVQIGHDGSVSTPLKPWPGNNSLPSKGVQSRALPEWEIVTIRAVSKLGTPRILAE